MSRTAVAAGMAASVAGMAWAVRGRSSAVFGPSAWRGDKARRTVALTFDDGPSPGTPVLLGVLEQYRIPATFFQIGENALQYPEIARAVSAAGHEIGNHSQTHPNFAGKPGPLIHNEFARGQQSLSGVTGCTPTLLRAPYGVRWFGFSGMQRSLGLRGVMWSVLGLDWKLPAAAIAKRVISRVRNGGIICLHDGRGTLKDPGIGATIEAVRRIVPDLLETGYHFETVTQILWPMK